MTQNPYPVPNPHDPRWQQKPSIVVPVLVGALTLALFHSLGLLDPELFSGMCFCCGLTGAPGGIVAAVMAARRDRTVRWGKGFLVAFLACSLGAVIAAVIFVLRDFEIPPDVVQEMERQLIEELKKENRPPDEIEAFRESTATVIQVVPYVVLGATVIVGSLCGLLIGGLMNRPPPAPPGYGYPEYGAGPGSQPGHGDHNDRGYGPPQ